MVFICLVSVFLTVFDANEKPVPQLSGMTCFVSPPKKGFLYNVFGKTKLISHCTYTTETAAAVICNNMLYAATSQALETYVTHTYPAIAKSARARRPLDVDDKLYTENPGELTNGDASEDDVVQNNDTAMTDLHDGVLSNSDSVLNNNPEANKNEDGIEDEDEGIRSSSDNNKFTHFGFPVYDLEILQKVIPAGGHYSCRIFLNCSRCSRLKVLPDKKYSPSSYFLGNKYSLWEISTPLPSIQYIAFFCLRGLGAIVMFHSLFDLESDPVLAETFTVLLNVGEIIFGQILSYTVA